jgi:hypothetical protein
MLTLAEAIKTGRLAEFAKQEEKRGVGPADTVALERNIAKAVKAPRSKRRTSRSPSGDGSRGK